MRGVMEFDDYNYKQFNPYILLKEGDIDRQKKKPSETVANATNITQVISQVLQKKNQEEQLKSEISENLSVQALDNLKEDYSHEAIYTEPSEK